MIIAVDFDDTLVVNGKPNTALLSVLAAEQAAGAFIILWTCRHGSRLKEAVTWCHKHHFYPNAINENAPEAVAKLGHNPRKIYADIYLDDKGRPVPY